MSGKLLKEIHKSKPFDSVEQEVFLNVLRTADHLTRAFEELLKPLNLSITQYNVLRILRGVEPVAPACGEKGIGEEITQTAEHQPCGVPCKTIGDHMITRDPDITRLLDRLEVRTLITRQRDTKDRRVVTTRITAEGLRILKKLDEPVLELHRRQLMHIPPEKLAQLIDLLETVRGVE
jgi:DNA-binding MarR family transcriptional regulator